MCQAILSQVAVDVTRLPQDGIDQLSSFAFKFLGMFSNGGGLEAFLHLSQGHVRMPSSARPRKKENPKTFLAAKWPHCLRSSQKIGGGSHHHREHQAKQKKKTSQQCNHSPCFSQQSVHFFGRAARVLVHGKVQNLQPYHIDDALFILDTAMLQHMLHLKWFFAKTVLYVKIMLTGCIEERQIDS